MNTLGKLKDQSPLGEAFGSIESIESFEWCTSKCQRYLFRYQANTIVKIFTNLRSSVEIGNFENTEVADQSMCIVQPYFAVTVKKKDTMFITSSPLRIPLPSDDINKKSTSLTPEIFPSSQTMYSLFYATLHSKDPIYARTVGYIKDLSSLHQVAKAISSGKALGVGDASVKSSKGGHAYVLESVPTRHRIHGVAPVDCVQEDLTSNRSEGCTVLAILIVSQVICEIFHITKGHISIMCDNKEALRRKQTTFSSYTKLVVRDVDIKMELKAILSSLPITVEFAHVPGHGDDDPNFDYEAAPQCVQRNVDMHYAVTAYMKYPPPRWVPTNVTPYFPNQQAALLIKDMIISGDIHEHIIMQKHGYAMEDRLQKKFNVHARFLHVIDWRSMKLAYSSIDLGHKVAATKILHGLWPTSSVLEARKTGQSDHCKRCCVAVETVTHVYRCSHRQSQSTYREAVLDFKKYLEKIKTAKPIQNVFVEFLRAFQQDRSPTRPKYSFGDKKKFDLLVQAYDHQKLLGANIFHLGYLSYKWAYVHGVYSPSKSKSAHTLNISWCSKVIKGLWNFSTTVWRKRCSWIYQKNSGINESLCAEELKASIQEYLRMSRDDLSHREKALHINVSKHMKNAYTTTLTRWLKLLANERAQTIRAKRNDRIGNGGLQPLTKKFRWRTSERQGT